MKMLIITAAAILMLAHSTALAQTPVRCGTGDDTAAVQAAINTNVVLLPNGPCYVSQLNGINKVGLFISGFGLNSELVPIRSGVNAVLDLTGSSHVILKDFRICGDCAPSISPTVALLLAQAQGSASSDALRIQNVRIDGCSSLASIYNLQVPSSRMLNSQIYNRCGFTMIHTGNNFFGAASAFVKINAANNMVPSDWDIFGTEVHQLNTATPQSAIWLGGVNGYRHFGGNISSSNHPVSINAVAINGVVVGPNHLIFDGTTFYSDSAPVAQCALKLDAAVPDLQLRGNPTGFPLSC
jgi:hypothetical protein